MAGILKQGVRLQLGSAFGHALLKTLIDLTESPFRIFELFGTFLNPQLQIIMSFEHLLGPFALPPRFQDHDKTSSGSWPLH